MNKIKLDKIASIGLNGDVLPTMCFYRDKCYVANGNRIKVINIESGIVEDEININAGRGTSSIEHIGGLAVSRDGRVLYITSNGGNLSYIIETKVIRKYAWISHACGYSIIEGKEGTLFSCGAENHINLFDIELGARIKTFFVDTRDYPISIKYDIAQDRLYAATRSGIIFCWNATSRIQIFRVSVYCEYIQSVDWNDGENIIILRGDGAAMLWKIAFFGMSRSDFIPCQDIKSIIMAPDNRNIIAGYKDGGLLIYNKDNFELIAKYHFASDQIKRIEITPDGCFLAIIDITYKFWLFRLDPAPVAPFYSGMLEWYTIPAHIELNASTGQMSILSPSCYETDLITTITSQATMKQQTDSAFFVFCPIKNSCPPQRQGYYIETVSNQEANGWMDAISAVRWHLQKPYKDRCMLPKAAITKTHRFDLLQLINWRNGGKGVLPGKTMPKLAMEIIGFYTMK
jgi:WD40 repeat protein